MNFTPHAYQQKAIDFVIDNPYCALFMDMGLGKTVSTLTALDILTRDYLDIGKILVIAPKSVAQNTWSAELRKWDHLRLSLSVVMGTAKERRAALQKDADVYVTNRDNTQWLVDQYFDGNRLKFTEPWPFDCVVLDESSSFKNFQSKRYKALYRMRPYMRRVILLTGTPAPNGLMDLWPQIKMLDMGERLGKYIGQFREAYFHPGARNGSVVYEYIPNKGAVDLITRKISDVCLSMKAEDYLDVPDLIEAGMTVQLPEMAAYRKFQKDCLLDLPDGGELLAVTAVSLSNKLLQFASGAVYDADHTWHEVSTAKMEALQEIIEQTDEPVLVYYDYRHELERMKAAIGDDVVEFHGEPDLLERWNAGKIKVLAAHPASVAYGLNMQQGGRIIVWFSPTWNLELYEQANARLHRQGQTKPVLLYHLICPGTMDEVVMTALKAKDNVQDRVITYINTLRQQL